MLLYLFVIFVNKYLISNKIFITIAFQLRVGSVSFNNGQNL